MGMDVYGQAPRSEAGKYFRRGMWSWPPLATWITTRWPELTSACQYWFSNDGDGLNDEQSVALADAIDAHLASGEFERVHALVSEAMEGYGGEYAPWKGSGRFPLRAEDMREFSAFLRDCGGFEIH